MGGKKSVMNSILLDVYLLDTFVPGQNASNGQGHSLYAILPSVQILYPMVLRHLDFPFEYVGGQLVGGKVCIKIFLWGRANCFGGARYLCPLSPFLGISSAFQPQCPPPQQHFPSILPQILLFANDHSPFLHLLFYRIHTGFYQSQMNSDMSMCPVGNSVVSSEKWSH